MISTKLLTIEMIYPNVSFLSQIKLAAERKTIPKTVNIRDIASEKDSS